MTKHLARRSLMVGISSGLFVLTGCLDRNGGEKLPTLNELHIVNLDDARYDVGVDLMYNGNEVLSDKIEVNPKNDGKSGGKQIESVWPEEPGRIFIEANMLNNDTTAELSLSDAGNSTYNVFLIIEGRDEMNFWYTSVTEADESNN